MFTLVYEIEGIQKSKPFERTTEAMNFAARLVKTHKSDSLKVNLLDAAGDALFRHDDIVKACQQVRDFRTTN